MGGGQVMKEVDRKPFSLMRMAEDEVLSDGGNDALRSQILQSQDTQRQHTQMISSDRSTRHRKVNSVIKSLAGPFSSTKYSELSDSHRKGNSPTNNNALDMNNYGTY